MGVHISFVQSLTLDSWKSENITRMKVGGNQRFKSYLIDHGVHVENISFREVYESKAAIEYRQQLTKEAGGETTSSAKVNKNDNHNDNIRISNADFQAMKKLVDQHVTLTFMESMKRIAPFLWHKLFIRQFPKIVFISVLFLGILVAGFVYWLQDYQKAVRLAILTLLGLMIPMTGLLCAFMANIFVQHRLEAFKSAKNLLLERIRMGRAERKPWYDLYLPPPPTQDVGQTRDFEWGLIFFPGACIDHTAYASIASQLSDRGITVAVRSLEPLRFATVKAPQDTLKIMYEIMARDDCPVKDFALGGHSAGAAAAFNLVKPMSMKKLVMFGANSSIEMEGTLAESRVDVLLVNASNDNIINRIPQSSKDHFFACLPPTSEKQQAPAIDGDKSSAKGSTTVVSIEGGNHSGFAHYGPQIFPVKDGDRIITLDEQQTQCANITADFLHGKPVNQIHSSSKPATVKDKKKLQ